MRVQRDGHLGGHDFQVKKATSQITGQPPAPRRTHAASHHPRLPRRRGRNVLPRCLGCCVGEPLVDPQPDAIPDVAHPHSDAIADVAHPHSDAIADVAHPQPNSIADPQANAIADVADPQANTVADSSDA